MAVLSDYRNRQDDRAAKAGGPLAADAYVFTLDPGGQTPWLPDSCSHAFERIARNVSACVRLHDLRHFAATHAIAAGIDARPWPAASVTPIRRPPCGSAASSSSSVIVKPPRS